MTSTLNKCKLVGNSDIIVIQHLLKMLNVLGNIHIFIVYLTLEINVTNLLVLFTIQLLNSSLDTYQFCYLRPFNFKFIVWVQNLDAVSRINVEVLFNHFFLIFFIVLYQSYLLNLNSAIVVPDFLVYVTGVPREKRDTMDKLT